MLDAISLRSEDSIRALIGSIMVGQPTFVRITTWMGLVQKEIEDLKKAEETVGHEIKVIEGEIEADKQETRKISLELSKMSFWRRLFADNTKAQALAMRGKEFIGQLADLREWAIYSSCWRRDLNNAMTNAPKTLEEAGSLLTALKVKKDGFSSKKKELSLSMRRAKSDAKLEIAQARNSFSYNPEKKRQFVAQKKNIWATEIHAMESQLFSQESQRADVDNRIRWLTAVIRNEKGKDKRSNTK